MVLSHLILFRTLARHNNFLSLIYYWWRRELRLTMLLTLPTSFRFVSFIYEDVNHVGIINKVWTFSTIRDLCIVPCIKLIVWVFDMSRLFDFYWSYEGLSGLGSHISKNRSNLVLAAGLTIQSEFSLAFFTIRRNSNMIRMLRLYLRHGSNLQGLLKILSKTFLNGVLFVDCASFFGIRFINLS